MRFIICLFILLAACGQDYNSDSSDQQLEKNKNATCDTAAFPLRCSALSVINTKCSSCHTHASWASLTQDSDWVSRNLVKAGNPQASSIIVNLINNGGNMPEGGSALSSSDYKILTDWIEGIK